MNVREAAASLGLTPSTVRAQLGHGRLAADKDSAGEWSIPPEEVERYREQWLGQRGKHHPSEATRALMRAAKTGRPLSVEHRKKLSDARRGKPLSESHRRHVSEALRGKPFTERHRAAATEALRRPDVRERRRAIGKNRTDAQRAGLPKLIAARREMTVLTPEHRAAISRGQVETYLSGRRPYSALEVRAGALLLPLGFIRFVSLDGHAFDLGAPDASVLIEVNGCRMHRHRDVAPACPFRPWGPGRDDERFRAIARDHGARLVELWQCEEADWPLLVHRLGPL